MSKAYRYSLSFHSGSFTTWYGQNQLHSFRKATGGLPNEGPSYLQTQRLHQGSATRLLRFFSASTPASQLSLRCPHNMGFFLSFAKKSCVFALCAFWVFYIFVLTILRSFSRRE